MSSESGAEQHDATLARRRRILYAAAAIGLLIVAAIAALPLLQADKTKTKRTVPVKTPVILARIEMRPVGRSGARGLGEVIRRGREQSLRVIAGKLRPNAKDEAYQLVLTGGTGGFKLLGTAVVGDQRLFVGESKTSIEQLEGFKRLELRRVTAGVDGTEHTVLRGRIPH